LLAAAIGGLDPLVFADGSGKNVAFVLAEA
jgi:hypothetical protein